MKIDGTTKSYGIIGWPVKHSLSPRFQNAFLKRAGINGVYLPFAVAPDLLEAGLQGLWALGVEGFNVTVPHKEQVFRMVDVEVDAGLIGAVNTVRRSDNGWLATNTDWRGFAAVVEGLGHPVAGATALLFGAGGTARAVVHALASLGISRLLICNRNPERQAGLVAFAQENYPDMICEALPWQQADVSRGCSEAQLLVNCTSIGLEEGVPFPFELGGDGIAVDAVYRPDGITAFTTAAGISREVVDGLPMLIAQGAASFAWWHDCALPDCRQALSDIESSLGRQPMALPGWG